MVLYMCQRIKLFSIAVFIIRRQLETVEIFKIVESLIAIEMLQIRYLHFICIDESSDTKTITEFAANFKIHIIKHGKFPFVKINITTQEILYAFVVLQLKCWIF